MKTRVTFITKTGGEEGLVPERFVTTIFQFQCQKSSAYSVLAFWRQYLIVTTILVF